MAQIPSHRLPSGPHFVARRHHAPPEPILIHAHQLRMSHLRAANRKETTISMNDLVIRRFEEWTRAEKGWLPSKVVPVSALNAQAVRQFLIYLRTELRTIHPLTKVERRVGPKSVFDHARVLKSFTRWMVAEEILDRDPLVNLKLPSVPKRVVPVFTEAEIKLLITAIDHRPNRTRNLALLFFLLSTGARITEACTLQWSSLDMRQKRAKVVGKGDKERWLYFDAATARLFVRLQAEVGDTGPVFLGRWGKQLSIYAAESLFRKWGEEAGLEECHPHMCRHTMATTFLRIHPGQVLQLQELLGHSQIVMVARYVRFVEATAPAKGPSVIESLNLARYAR